MVVSSEENLDSVENVEALPNTYIGMAEAKGYVERVYLVKGKPPNKTIDAPNPTTYSKTEEGAVLYFKCIVKNCKQKPFKGPSTSSVIEHLRNSHPRDIIAEL